MSLSFTNVGVSVDNTKVQLDFDSKVSLEGKITLPPDFVDNVLLEDSCNLLLEDSCLILLE